MKIDVILTPAEIDDLPERDLTAQTCVVFDVLRATSSIITALAHRALEVYPVSTIEEALTLRESHPEALLGGERNGEIIDGFDLGNSPLEYRSLAGRKIITTTTNGTIALRAVAGSTETLVGALLNLEAIVRHLRAAAPSNLLIICAGTFRDFALEDGFAAGRLIAELPEPALSDSAALTLWISQQHKNRALDCLQKSRNGRVLADKGRLEEVRFCAQESCYDVVPTMQNGVITTTQFR